MDLSLGIWKSNELKLQNERNVLKCSEYHDPIERFPDSFFDDEESN
jgi:hypothetical protein